MDNGVRDDVNGIVNLTTDPPSTLPELLYRKYSNTEYRRGIIASAIPIRMTKIIGTDSAGQPISTYLDAAVRHHFQVAKARNRVVSVTASFQPYLVPGFPIAVEDESGPFYGMLDEVVHTLSPESAPMTTLRISHVRDLRDVRGGVDPDPTPLLPAWLNAQFRPENVNATYRALLGCPAAVDLSGVVASTGESNVNLGQLFSKVFPVPTYNADAATWSSGTLSEANRADVQTSRFTLTWQHRPGVNLAAYAQWHGWKSESGIENAFKEPPTELGDASPMFDIPTSTGPDGAVATTDPSKFRQIVARRIQEQLNAGIARD
jgi:hypothetical protein